MGEAKRRAARRQQETARPADRPWWRRNLPLLAVGGGMALVGLLCALLIGG